MSVSLLFGLVVLPAIAFGLAYYPILHKLSVALVSPYAKADLNKRLSAITVDGLLVMSALVLYRSSESLLFVFAGAVYVLLRDAMWGRSVGKFFFGLVVIQVETGRPCGHWGSLNRNLLFLLPGANIAGAFLETATILRDPQGQRLGDRFAQTQVVEGLGAKDVLTVVQEWWRDFIGELDGNPRKPRRVNLPMITLIRCMAFTAAVFMALGGAVVGQTLTETRRAISGGITFPSVSTYFGPGTLRNGEYRDSSIPERQTMVPSYWAEGVFWIKPRITFHLTGEYAPAFGFTRAYQTKGFSYSGTVQHRQTTVSALVGVGSTKTRRVGIRGTAGAAFVSGYTSEVGSTTYRIDPGPVRTEESEHTKVTLNMALMGGVEARLGLANHVYLVPRLRAWWMSRDVDQNVSVDVADVFNRFSVNSGIGIEVQF
jgi:hypothetical protein